MDEFHGPPKWKQPAPLGYGQAADAAHFVAAPLLASAAIALIGVIAAGGNDFRWPGLAMLALASASLLLVASIQYGFHARGLLYSAEELKDWWGPEDFEDRKEWLQEIQQKHFGQWRNKINKAVTSYNFGIALLGVGVTLCLAPPADLNAANAVPRWLACGAVAVGSLGELVYGFLQTGWQFALPGIARRSNRS